MVQLNPYWHEQWAAYFDDPVTQFEWVLRRTRARQIRRLLADPQRVDLQTFTHEVWLFGPTFEFQGREYRFYNDFHEIPLDQLASLRQAIETEALVLHGNYMWDTPQHSFDQNCHDESVKIDNIRRALTVLNAPHLVPAEKARQIMDIRGFGSNSATALVWLYHPDQYAICNRRSIYAVNLIMNEDLPDDHPPLREVVRFQALASEVRGQLEAPDLLVLDSFFDVVYWTGLFAPVPDSEVPVTEDERDAYPEGGSKYVTHLRYERNRDLVEMAKRRFLERHGLLYCEVCKFDFAATYGERGEGFIEAHHKIPVSQMNGAGYTRVTEVALVCPNCHKMLHRHQPLLSVKDLQDLIAAQKQRAAKG